MLGPSQYPIGTQQFSLNNVKCEICEREFTQGLWNKHYVMQHWQRENIKENNNTKGLPLVGSHHHCLKCLQLHTLTKWINQTFLNTLFWGLGTSFRNFIWSPWMGHCWKFHLGFGLGSLFKTSSTTSFGILFKISFTILFQTLFQNSFNALFVIIIGFILKFPLQLHCPTIMWF